MRVIELLVRFNSNRIYLIILALFLINHKSLSQVYPDQLVHKALKSGIELIVDQKYDEAINIFETLDKFRKDLPLGKIYLAATLIAESYDYQQPFNDDKIKTYLDEAINLSENLLKKDDTNIWYNYFYALSTGYSAYYDALKNNWLSALTTAINSVSAFEYCFKLDDHFYESLIAIGNYKFWRSKKTEYFNWLPFLDDEKVEGIEYLKKAINSSGYNSYLATYSLTWIYIEQEDYANAIKIAEKGLLKNPTSRLFKWGLARAYEEIDPAKAISLYFDILNSYPLNILSNKINEITLKHIIAQQYLKIGKNAEAIKLCDEILSIQSLSGFEKRKLGDRIERVIKLKNELKSK